MWKITFHWPILLLLRSQKEKVNCQASHKRPGSLCRENNYLWGRMRGKRNNIKMISKSSFTSSFQYGDMHICLYFLSSFVYFPLSLVYSKPLHSWAEAWFGIWVKIQPQSTFFRGDLWKVFFYVFLSILGMPKNNLQVGNSIQSQILPLFFITLFVAFLESFTADIEVFDFFFWICNFPELFYRPI